MFSLQTALQRSVCILFGIFTADIFPQIFCNLQVIKQKIKSYSGAATYSYTMKPAPNGVMITEATVQEIHQFTPQYEIGDATQMETRLNICSCAFFYILNLFKLL